MSGLEAISHYNGWAMAVTGASIVISGLAILAILISQLHRFIALLEKKENIEVDVAPVQEAIPDKSLDPLHLVTIIESYRPLVAELDDPFELGELYVLANKYHLPHPHLSIRCLREAGKLQSAGEGLFCMID